MTVKRDCSGTAYDITGFHRCFRNATVERDGEWWCWQHDPERVAGDKEKRLADWRAKSAREIAIYARRARNAKLAKLVTPELAALLERLAYGVGNIATDERAIEAFALAAHIREVL